MTHSIQKTTSSAAQASGSGAAIFWGGGLSVTFLKGAVGAFRLMWSQCIVCFMQENVEGKVERVRV